MSRPDSILAFFICSRPNYFWCGAR